MFEKEAEEYSKETFCGEVFHTARNAFKDGAKFGYNKANEEIKQNGLALQSDMDKTIEQNIALKKELDKAKKWHYVENELPKKEKYVLVYTILKNLYLARLIKDNYFINKNGGLVQTSNVIAWKEIVLPKESE